MTATAQVNERATRWARTGMTWALLPGLLLLFALAVALLRSEGSSVKVLVAVWLWMLPLLGIFAAAGWGAGRLAAALVGDRSRAMPVAVAPDPGQE